MIVYARSLLQIRIITTSKGKTSVWRSLARCFHHTVIAGSPLFVKLGCPGLNIETFSNSATNLQLVRPLLAKSRWSCTTFAFGTPFRSLSSSTSTLALHSGDLSYTAPAEMPIPMERNHRKGPVRRGREFYESIGSPRKVLAPMVNQSEFVCACVHLCLHCKALLVIGMIGLATNHSHLPHHSEHYLRR